MSKRLFDITLSLLALSFAALPCLLLACAIRATSDGPAIYWSDRVGRRNKIFRMPKFRTMRIDTPAVATNLLANPAEYVTPLGRFLRKTSLDELPQLWSVLVGDMSLVGPRPALYNEHELVDLRTKAGVDALLPGLTGWAQVNGRDEIDMDQKVTLDAEYLWRQSLLFDIKILLFTAHRVLRGYGILH
jgi:O-antigen biosynthesis protein WbqP